MIERIFIHTSVSSKRQKPIFFGSKKIRISGGSACLQEVTVLHVIPDILEELSTESGIDFAEHLGKEEWQNFNKNGIAKAKAAIQKRIRETSRRVTQEIPYCPLTEDKIIIKVGNPVRQIVQTAEEGDFDLVLMGTHGHGKIEEAFTGSVARGVIRQCSRPVMVVRLSESRKDVDSLKPTHADASKDAEKSAIRIIS